MPPHAPDILRGIGVAVNRVSPQEELVTIVVPRYELQIHAAGLEGRAQVVADEVALLLGAVEAVLPRAVPIRLVLHGETPERKPLLLQRLREKDIMLGPKLPTVRFQLATRAHGPCVLHPRRWAPWTRQERQRSTRSLVGLPDKRKHGLLVAVDAEAGQVSVVLAFAAGPISVREVARVHVQPADVKAQTCFLVEIGVDDSFLIGRAQLRKNLGRGFREGRAKACELLELHIWVNDQSDLTLHWPLILELERRQTVQTLACASRTPHHCHETRLWHRHLAERRRHAGAPGGTECSVKLP
mmetsp:Transcript_76458/g.248051  ORF Transcript_76458/g.248051 Transcript_76458/m.248051 type:complete len:299 (+) Transcript_76458:762-1658(+)